MPAKLFFAFCALLSAPLAAASIDIVAGPDNIRLNEPFAVAFDRDGNWYILEHKGQRIVRAGKDGTFSPFAGASAGIQAQFHDPHGMVVSRDGRTMFVADTLNNQIRKIDLRSRTITTLAGTGEKSFSGDNGSALQATFNGVFSIALGHDEKSLFIADLSNRRIRKIDLSNGIVTTVAGDGTRGIPADGAPAASSPLEDPRAVAVDSKGLLYIVERNGNALRVVERNGRIRTLIAPGQLQPDLKGPKHLCVDSKDNVIIADAENHLIRRYNPRDGSTVTIAGTGKPGAHVDPSDPLKTEMNRPHGVVFNRAGDLYISDSDNHRILRLRP